MNLLEEIFRSCIAETNGVKEIRSYAKGKGLDEKIYGLLLEIVVTAQREAFEYGFGSAIKVYTEAISVIK